MYTSQQPLTSVFISYYRKSLYVIFPLKLNGRKRYPMVSCVRVFEQDLRKSFHSMKLPGYYNYLNELYCVII